MKRPGTPKSKPEKVTDAGVSVDTAYMYFIDKDGDVSRSKRAVGGQKRKSSAKAKAKKAPKAAKGAKKASKKAAPKKAAKKAAKKPAKASKAKPKKKK